MKKVPDYAGSSFNPEKLPNDDLEPSAERAKMHEEYAGYWNAVSYSVCIPENKINTDKHGIS